MNSLLLRLDKIISNQLGLSRRQVRLFCRQGRVKVDGRPVFSCEQKVDPSAQEVTVDGRPLAYRAFVYLMLHKPAGILSASRDPSRPTVVDLAPEEFSHRPLFPVGRLDRDTTGLLLLTDDGETAHGLLSPRRHVPKVYEALLDAPLPDGAAQAFAQGITLADGCVCRPCELTVISAGDKPVVRLVLTEGMYHQVKRMFGVLGLGVDALRRVAMGPLVLDSALAPGECRELTDCERELLLAAARGSGAQEDSSPDACKR